jgi:pimeloyl-ACP methyl ester carboxylesterase
MRLASNGLQFEVDVQGPADGEPLLMIMGLGMQLTAWPEELVQMLVQRGFRVIRLDNRDAGLSDGFDAAGMPNLGKALLRHAVRLPVGSAYGLDDMARDTLGVMDALGLQSAHIAGASMGGMISQHIASLAPERVRSLTLMMTTPGRRSLPQPNLKLRLMLTSRPKTQREEDRLAHSLGIYRAIGSPGYPQDAARLRERVLSNLRRAYRPSGTARQLMAVVADGDRSAMLRRLQVPSLVLHGEADPLVPVAHGRELQRCIPGARGQFVPGWGHDLPPGIWPLLAQAIGEHAARRP